MAFRFEDHLARMDRRVESGSRDGQETALVIAGRTYATTALDLWERFVATDRGHAAW